MLSRPADDTQTLQNLNNTPYKMLREEFRQQLDSFIATTLKETKLKTIGGCTLTGRMWLSMVHEYVNAMNSQKIPQILSSFSRVQQAEREKIINEIYEDFDN